MKKSISLIVLVLFFNGQLFSQNYIRSTVQSDTTKTTVVQTVQNAIPENTFRERVYVQTDKQLYMAGELLWLKFYTTDADGKLADLSKVGYVELVSDSILEKQIKIEISEGTGTGWLELSPMLSTGYYRLIAYTRFMRNEGNSVFFEKTIGVINPYIRNEKSFIQDEENQIIGPVDLENSTNAGYLSADRITYEKRTRGEIRIKGLPAENFSLAVSVVGKDPVFTGAPVINSWKEGLHSIQDTKLSKNVLPEYEGLIIEGKLINTETNQPENELTTSVYISFPGKELQLFPGRVDNNGNVTFVSSRLSGKKEIATVAFNSPDKKYRVDLTSPFVIHQEKLLPPLRIDSGWQDYIKRRHLGIEVMESYIADSLSRIEPISSFFYYKPYRSFLLDDYTRFSNMEEVFVEFIPIVRLRRSAEGRSFNAMTERLDGYASGSSLVLFDNIPVTDQELMATYNPLMIKKIDVYLGKYAWGNQSFDGIVAFYSYNNDYPGLTFDSNTQLFDFDGTQAYRYFYSPVYGDSTGSRLPDFRHTLLWEPTIQSNKDREIVIPFYTSDLTGTFLITVEGISPAGTIISEQQSIEIR